MGNTEKDLQKTQEEFKELICVKALEERLTKYASPIYDGVADIGGYLASKPKIMWIMKESYDEVKNGKPSGGGYSIPDNIFAGNPEKDPGAKNFETDIIKMRMWKKIIYATYGIHSGTNSFNSIENYFADGTDSEKMRAEVQKIAYINVSKMPGLKKTNISTLEKQFNDYWSEIVYKQIDAYAPDVIIIAKTFSFFMEHFGISEKDKVYSDGTTDVYKSGGKLFVDVYHPSYWTVSTKKYVESLVNSCQLSL